MEKENGNNHITNQTFHFVRKKKTPEYYGVKNEMK